MTPRRHPRRPKIDPRRLQDDLQEVFFSHRFLSSILVGLGSDFGSQKGAPREPKSVIFGIDFSLIFTCRSKIAPRAAKRGPRAPQERPRAAQEEPKSGPRAPKRAPRAAKSDPRGPKTPEKRAKRKRGPCKRSRQPKRERKDKEGHASEAGGQKESEKITRAVQGCAWLCLAVLSYAWLCLAVLGLLF